MICFSISECEWVRSTPSAPRCTYPHGSVIVAVTPQYTAARAPAKSTPACPQLQSADLYCRYVARAVEHLLQNYQLVSVSNRVY
jgi:hypothetical protein